MPVIPNAAYIALAPDWLCEVVSPSTGRIDRSRKMHVYAREGVRHLWYVDPLTQTLEDGRWVVASTHGGRVAVRAEPFEAITVDLDRWWIPATDPA